MDPLSTGIAIGASIGSAIGSGIAAFFSKRNSDRINKRSTDDTPLEERSVRDLALLTVQQSEQTARRLEEHAGSVGQSFRELREDIHGVEHRIAALEERVTAVEAIVKQNIEQRLSASERRLSQLEKSRERKQQVPRA